jgi:hypothetical protein
MVPVDPSPIVPSPVPPPPRPVPSRPSPALPVTGPESAPPKRLSSSEGSDGIITAGGAAGAAARGAASGVGTSRSSEVSSASA